MKTIILLFAMALPFHAAGAPLGATVPVPSEWHTVYVVFLERADDAPPLTDDALSMLNMLHIQFHLRLRADGHAFTAGRFGEGDDSASMAILCADDVATARTRAEADPMVQFGQRRVVVRPWQVPVSVVDCVPEGQ